MPFKIEFEDEAAIAWDTTTDGATATRDSDYTPSIYVAASQAHLDALQDDLTTDPKVVATAYEHAYTTLQADTRSRVLRVDLERPGEIRTLARELRSHREMAAHPPGTFRLYNVDIAPQFRYCLATGHSPVPDRDLSTLELDIDEKALAQRDVSRIGIGDDVLSGDPEELVRTVQARVRDADPDVLVFTDAGLVPLLFEQAREFGIDQYQLGRRPGYTRLAGENTFESYGVVGHSAARYDVPGRVIIDRSNSFMWSETNMAGLLDLVRFSWKPLQETGWASIGNVLTAIQIREAIERDVLIPWNKWQPEAFKDVRTLHAADRGGFTFAPEVGVHEDVVEVDFSSLYPRIMVTRNISPDTVLCECHADREDVPVIGYNVCDDRGFLADVLEPLLDHRADLKAKKREALANGDEAAAAVYDKRSNAFKWILVSCFGYQGYRNSKFGRIECHEAINAYAREILLTAKEHCERAGWEIKHGIVDSLWISRRDSDADSIDELTDRISTDIGIPLEREAAFEWVAFVPKRESNAGALTKYFGKRAPGDRRGESTYKYRGIEARQRSTPPFVEAVQRDLIEVLDTHRSPEPVCDRLESHLERLRAGDIDPSELVIRTRVSKNLEAYTQQNLSVAALQRGRMHDMTYQAGQDVRYVVVDDDAQSRERVRLHFEAFDDYDADYYETQLIRATESVTSPLGWDRHDIRDYLSTRVNSTLLEY